MPFKSLPAKDVFRYALGAYWSMVSSVYIFLITFTTLAPLSQRYADTILGFLMGTIVATIINDAFGSSEGSRSKSDDLRKILTSKTDEVGQ